MATLANREVKEVSGGSVPTGPTRFLARCSSNKGGGEKKQRNEGGGVGSNLERS